MVLDSLGCRSTQVDILTTNLPFDKIQMLLVDHAKAIQNLVLERLDDALDDRLQVR